MRRYICLLLYGFLVPSYLIGQQSYFGGVSGLYFKKNPKINYGFTIGTNYGFQGRNSSKLQLTLAIQFHFPKKYTYTSVAYAEDSLTTSPYELELNSKLKIGYLGAEVGGIYYIIGNESGEFGFYSKFGVNLLTTKYSPQIESYDQSKYSFKDNNLIGYEFNENKSYLTGKASFYIGLGVEKRVKQHFVFFDFKYSKILIIEGMPIYPVYFYPFGDANTLYFAIGLRILKL